MAKILLLNGPNLNLLGTREPEIYGRQTLDEINDRLILTAEGAGHNLSCFQSNAEHELVERVHRAIREQVEFIIVNPAAYTHTSIALRDAFLGSGIPFVEVHLSNTCQRETYRHRSFFSDIAEGVLMGLGPVGYRLALDFVIERLR